jgi:hypothetical protein
MKAKLTLTDITLTLLSITVHHVTTPTTAVGLQSTNGTDSCTTSWQFYNGSHSVGAKRLDQYKTLEACLAACADVITNCVAVDVNFNGADDVIECWAHMRVDPLEVKYGDPRVIQGLLVRRCPTIAVCTSNETTVGWRMYANQNSFWGILQSTDHLAIDDCLHRCATNSRCLAVDFDDTLQPANCYHHMALDFAASRGGYPGTDQYVVDSRCFSGSGQICSTGWILTLDKADFGSPKYQPAKTQDECQFACFHNPNCTGYDYWPKGPTYCWLATQSNKGPLTTDIGNYHYDLIKSCQPII